MYSLDFFIQSYVSSIRTVFVTELMYITSTVFDASLLFLFLSLFVSLFIYAVRNIRYACLFFASLFSTAVVVYILKHIFNVSRPLNGIVAVFSPSFPSYHATIASVFFIMLMYIFDDYLSSFWRIIFNTFCILSIFVVAFSRIYLGVHWLSDVLAGIVIGGILSYCFVLVFRKKYMLK